MNRLHGKVAVVTGAGRGIGRAIAEAFFAEGATTIATGRAPADDSFAPGINYEQLEVSREEDWKRVIASVVAEHGHIDALVNNAGIIVYDALHELSLADWDKVVGVNQTSVFLGMREVIPHMIAQGGGSIINISSIWGNAAVSGAHVYHATKGAVRNMSKSAAITYAKENVRVNSLHPGFIWTPLTQGQAPEINEYVISQTPMGRPGTPEEIAAGAVFLASDEASFVTGSELVIDGGYLAQ
jgi:NAD(P)-dependent dehydrogenase (short-subunit alcohol dehydrogenase family)